MKKVKQPRRKDNTDQSIKLSFLIKPEWSKGVCPNCGYPKADLDPEGILWCPACGYSKKGCYT